MTLPFLFSFTAKVAGFSHIAAKKGITKKRSAEKGKIKCFKDTTYPWIMTQIDFQLENLP